ncbi:MAG TPA: nitrate reductase, partial [Blastococcus sp.]
GIIIGIGNVALVFTDTFSLTGIALGTIVAVLGWHIARVLAPAEMREALRSEAGYYGGTGPALGEFGAHEVSETGADREDIPHTHR